jgi:hypothetical protein
MLAILQTREEVDFDAPDRRIFGRARSHVQADAKRLDHTIPACRQPRLRLHVKDVSVGGLSALTDQPVAEGEQIAVHFDPRTGLPNWSAYGHVVRCEPSALGYRVAVEFDPRPAA